MFVFVFGTDFVIYLSNDQWKVRKNKEELRRRCINHLVLDATFSVELVITDLVEKTQATPSVKRLQTQCKLLIDSVEIKMLSIIKKMLLLRLLQYRYYSFKEHVKEEKERVLQI